MVPGAQRPTMAERLWAKVKKSDGCWEWRGSLDSHGYGTFSVGHGVVRGAHRVAYELVRGPIPPGLQLDHLCRNPRCCNPDHLEPVTQRVNLLRGNGACARHAAKTHCIHGHPLSDDNLLSYPLRKGHRLCRTCHLGFVRAYRARKLAGLAGAVQ